MNQIEKKVRHVPLISVAAIHSPVGGLAKWSLAVALDSQGCIRFFEMDDIALGGSMRSWKQMMGVIEKRDTSTQFDKQREGEGESKPRFGVNEPKHGKEDEKNEPHVGGNTWAGGTGGSDTAGLGGRGGNLSLFQEFH
jgi:von Willebrand factor A domain-containing protein 8